MEGQLTPIFGIGCLRKVARMSTPGPGRFQRALGGRWLAAAMAAVWGSTLSITPAAGHPLSVQEPRPIPNGEPVGERCQPPHNELEPAVAVDPLDSGNIVVAWIEQGGGVGVARSADGGTSWSTVHPDGLNACNDQSFAGFFDVRLSFGLTDDDSIVYLSLKDRPDGVTDRILVVKSEDGGATWSEARVVRAGPILPENPEMPSITADPDESCRVYAVWTTLQTETVSADTHRGAEMASTSDCGERWSIPESLTETTADVLIQGPRILVRPDNSLLHVFALHDQATYTKEALGVPIASVPVRIMVQRSTDEGETWSAPLEIGQAANSVLFDPDGRPIGEASVLPTADVAADGTVYVAWANNEGGVLLVESADGENWSEPRTVVSVDQGVFYPALAVAPDGTVGITYYDFRNDVPSDEALTTDVWFAHADPGSTEIWDEVHLAGPFDMRAAGLLGNYQGLATFPGGFAAAFAMGSSEAKDVFFAAIWLGATESKANSHHRLGLLTAIGGGRR